jgi:hypothetical protein
MLAEIEGEGYKSRTVIEDGRRASWGSRFMPTAETAFVAKVREQIEFLQNDEYSYDELHIYVAGIGEPWVFGRAADRRQPSFHFNDN